MSLTNHNRVCRSVLSGFFLGMTSLLLTGGVLSPASAQTLHPASDGSLASALGALNAAHASSEAATNAAPRSRVGQISAYDKAMLTALALPATTSAEVTYRNQQIALARSSYLVSASNKPLSPAVVSKVDALLGLPASDPSLGLTNMAGNNRDVTVAQNSGATVSHGHVEKPTVEHPNFEHPNIHRPDIQIPHVPH